MGRVWPASRTVARQAPYAPGKSLGGNAVLQAHGYCHGRVVEQGIEKRALLTGPQEYLTGRTVLRIEADRCLNGLPINNQHFREAFTAVWETAAHGCFNHYLAPRGGSPQ